MASTQSIPDRLDAALQLLRDNVPDDLAVTGELVDSMMRGAKNARTDEILASLLPGAVAAVAKLERRVLKLENSHDAS